MRLPHGLILKWKCCLQELIFDNMMREIATLPRVQFTNDLSIVVSEEVYAIGIN